MGDNKNEGFSYISPQIQKKNAFQALLIELIVIFGVIAVAFFILNSYGILTIGKILPIFSFLNSEKKADERQNIPTPVPSNEIVGAPQVKIFSCPVAKEDCGKGIVENLASKPGILYKVAQGTSIKTLSFYVLESVPYKETIGKDELIGYSQTFIYNNMCYTATYLFPSDFEFTSIPSAPFGENVELGKATATKFTLAKNSGNVFIQLQKRPLDGPLQARKERESCNLVDRDKKDYGIYELLSDKYFN